MTIVPSKYWWLLLPAYPALGLALGLADPWLGQLARQAGLKPGWATAVTVNVLLPLAAVGLGLAHARVVGALLGAAALTLGLIAGLAVQYSADLRAGSMGGVLGSVPPVLVAACLGYAALGAAAAVVRRAWVARAPSR
jgi:hypothetical protein